MEDPMEAPAPTSTTEQWAAGLSLTTAVIHGLVTPAHFEAWWGYGLFFIGVTSFQALFALALWTRAINPRDFGQRWARAKRRLLFVAIVVNLAVIAMWIVSRTWGIPAGPELGRTESVGVLDVASKIAEAILVVLLVVAYRAVPRDASPGAS